VCLEDVYGNGGLDPRILICGLFNNATLSSDYIGPSIEWLGKDVEGSGRGLYQIQSRNLHGGTEENFSKDIRRHTGIQTRQFPNTCQKRYRFLGPLVPIG
jgi:hypothetical protein